LARREPLSRSARDGQTVWVKGGRDDQGFPLSVSVTVSVTV
jgi:ribosomal protein S6E (S10)